MAIALLAGSFGLSAVLTGVMRKVALRTDFVARPTADRYHRSVIPLGGGAAVFLTLSAAILSAIVVVKFPAVPGLCDWLAERTALKPADFIARMNELWVVWLSAAVLFTLGLWDDKKHLGPFVKLAIQCLVAIAAVVFGDIRVEFFMESRALTSIFSAIWIALIINVFNFLDNMDGASAGIAVIVSTILFTAAVLSGQILVGGLALVFVGALLGFLVFNFPPAKIFMGDAGSLVVGFFVALLSLRTTYYHEANSGSWYSIFLPLVVMAVPLYDFVSVSLLRISQGKSPFVGDTQHFSHRLKRHGLTDTQTVLVLYLATLCTGLGATFLYQVNLAGAILILVQTVLVLFIIAVFESTVS